MRNNNCNGSGPCAHGPEVRQLPFPGGTLILCRACYGREMLWRIARNRELAPECRFDTPTWASLAIY